MMTVNEWMESPEIVLPWKGVETGFTLTSWKGVCPTCNVELVKPRGKIYESFSVVELEIGGICSKCEKLVLTRSRVYPKTGEFAQKTGNGWERKKMSKTLTFNQRWLRESMRMFMPMIGVTIIVLVMTLLVATPTKWTYILNGVWVGFFGTLSIVFGYLSAKGME
jgi:hypothetical protein